MHRIYQFTNWSQNGGRCTISFTILDLGPFHMAEEKRTRKLFWKSVE